MKNKRIYLFTGLMFLLVFVGIGAVNVRSEPTEIGVKRNETGIYDIKLIKDVPYVITINDNWSKTVEMYDWCTGKGTEIDPYVIQNVRIDIKDGRYGIKINKGINFVIRNCIFTNTIDVGEKTAGIYVIESEGGKIEHNNFTFCKTGIFSVESNKIDISYNSFIGDFKGSSGIGKALWVYGAVELVVTYNYIIDYYDGIGIWDAKDSKVENNRIENYKFGYEAETGIVFTNVNYSTIINNDLYGVDTSLQETKEISISGTSIVSYFNVINLYNSYHIEISGNRFYDMNGNLINPVQDLNILLIVFMFLTVISVVIGIIYIVRKKFKD